MTLNKSVYGVFILFCFVFAVCMGFLMGTVRDSRSLFHQLNPRWFLQPGFMGSYLPGTGTLGYGPGVGLELLGPVLPLPDFYLPHTDVGPAHFCLYPSCQSGWMWLL